MTHIYVLYIVPLSILIPLITAAVNYKFLNNELKTIVLFLIVSALFNSVAIFYASHHKNNLFVLHFYAIFEFGLLSWFYKLTLKGAANKIIPVLMVLFTVLCIVNYTFIQQLSRFNTYTRSLEAIIIVAYSTLLFGKQNLTEEDRNWGSISYNWINTGILIYYAGCFFSFLLSNYLLNSSRFVNRIVWVTVDTALLVEYVLFAIGFYKAKYQSIIPVSS